MTGMIPVNRDERECANHRGTADDHMSMAKERPIHRRPGARGTVASAIFACHAVILASVVAPALTPQWPAVHLLATAWCEPNRLAIAGPPVGDPTSPGRECEDGIWARVAGAAGIVVISLGLHMLLTVAAILSERLDLLRQGWRWPEAGGRGYPVHRGRRNYQAPRLPIPSKSDVAFDSLVDMRDEARSGRRRSRIIFVSVLLGIFVFAPLLPLGVLVPLFFLFGLVTTALITLRDWMTAELGKAADVQKQDRAKPSELGPPLFFVAGTQVFPVLGLMFIALNVVGMGLLFAWVAGSAIVCHDTGAAGAIMRAVISLALLCAGILLLRLARVTATSRAFALLSRDDRAPILYLRSFKDDALRMRTERAGRRTWLDSLASFGRERFEEVIAWYLWSYGPVIAIDRPDGTGQSLGAARQELPVESWTRDIQEWLTAARLIVMTVGRTAGVQWEAEQIRRLGLWPKVILLFPPLPEAELTRRWQEFRHIAFQRGRELPHPVDEPGALAAVVSSDERATAYIGASRDEWAYQVALDAASRALSVFPVAWKPIRPVPSNLRDRAPSSNDSSGHSPPHLVSLESSKFFLFLKGEVTGPYSLLDLRHMIGIGRISARTLANVGSGPWFPIADIPRIFSDRSRSRALALSIFGGGLGLDQFYLGNIGAGIGKLLTLGGLGVWWMFDILLLLGQVVVTDARGKPLR